MFSDAQPSGPFEVFVQGWVDVHYLLQVSALPSLGNAVDLGHPMDHPRDTNVALADQTSDALLIGTPVSGLSTSTITGTIEREVRCVDGWGAMSALALAEWGAHVVLESNPFGADSNGRLIARELEHPNLTWRTPQRDDIETPYRMSLIVPDALPVAFARYGSLAAPTRMAHPGPGEMPCQAILTVFTAPGSPMAHNVHHTPASLILRDAGALAFPMPDVSGAIAVCLYGGVNTKEVARQAAQWDTVVIGVERGARAGVWCFPGGMARPFEAVPCGSIDPLGESGAFGVFGAALLWAHRELPARALPAGALPLGALPLGALPLGALPAQARSWNTEDWARGLREAATAAALKGTHPGARPIPSRAEIEVATA